MSLDEELASQMEGEDDWPPLIVDDVVKKVSAALVGFDVEQDQTDMLGDDAEHFFYLRHKESEREFVLKLVFDFSEEPEEDEDEDEEEEEPNAL